MFKFSCSIEWCLFISFKLNFGLFLLLLYRLVSVMNIQEARCLSRKKGNNLLAQSVDMKLRRQRISACQVRLLRMPVEWLAFTLSLYLSFIFFLSAYVCGVGCVFIDYRWTLGAIPPRGRWDSFSFGPTRLDSYWQFHEAGWQESLGVCFHGARIISMCYHSSPLAYVASTLPVVCSVPAAVVKYCSKKPFVLVCKFKSKQWRLEQLLSCAQSGGGECMVVLSLLSHSQ